MTIAEALNQWTVCASAGQHGDAFFRQDNDQPLGRVLRRFDGATVEEVATDVGGYKAVVKVIPQKPKAGRQNDPLLLFVN